MAIIFLLFLFGVALLQLLFRWLKGLKLPERKKRVPKHQKNFDLLDFDEFADIMDEEGGEK